MKRPLLISILVLISGCIQQEAVQEKVSDKDKATSLCMNLCKSKLSEGTDLNNGPCLSNETLPDWICDVAHSPRQPVDNKPENQCSSFRNGETHHFVEVDTSCNLIKTY